MDVKRSDRFDLAPPVFLFATAMSGSPISNPDHGGSSGCRFLSMSNFPMPASSERLDPACGVGSRKKHLPAILIVALATLVGCGTYDQAPSQLGVSTGVVDSMAVPFSNRDFSGVLTLSNVASAKLERNDVDSGTNTFGVVPVMRKFGEHRISVDLVSASFQVVFRLRDIHPYLADFHHGVILADYRNPVGDWSEVKGEVWTMTPMDSTLPVSRKFIQTIQVSDSTGMFLRLRETLFVY